MKNVFVASFCHNGILGGAIYVDTNKVTYRTNKVTIEQEYRNLELPYSEIAGLTNGWMLFFPTVLIRLKNNKEYKFIIFNRKSFLERLKEYGL